jgi:hypothetical protein
MNYGASDHPSGGHYETQAERFGTGGVGTARKPKVLVQQSFTFDEDQIKQILAEYVSSNFGVVASAADVDGDYSSGYHYNQFDSQSPYCKFTVTVTK